MTGDEELVSQKQKFGYLLLSKELVFILDESPDYYECLQCNAVSGTVTPALVIIPKSSIEIVNDRATLKSPDLLKSVPLNSHISDSLLTILACAMRDWHPILQDLVSNNQTEMYRKLGDTIEDLTCKTKLLLSSSLTKVEEDRIRQQVITALDQMNQELGFDALLFENGQIMKKSPLKLLHHYAEEKHQEQDLFRKVEFQFQAFVGTFCKSGEQIELQFSIFDSARGESVSETFSLHLDSNGTPIMDQQLSCVFEEINFKQAHLYLLTRIIRLSEMSHTTSQKADLLKAVRKKLSRNNLVIPEEKMCVRQPVGYALFPLSEVIKTIATSEHRVSISMLPENFDGREWSRPTTATLPSISDRIAFSIGVYKSNHLGINRISIPPSGLFRSNSPSTDMNKMYITLQSGKFSTPKANGFSCEVTCQIRFPDGSFADSGINVSETISNLSEFKSVVIPNCTDPFWNDTFQINLKPKEFAGAHLFLTFKSAGKIQEGKVFAFAFMPLVQGKNVMIHDGVHELTLYKYEEKLVHPSNYLSFPAGPNLLVPVHLSLSSITSIASAAQATSKLPALGHTVYVQSRLFSTLFSQDVNLVNFIRWKRTDSMSRSPLVEVVLNLQNVGELDMATMCKPILHAFIDLFFEMGPDFPATLFDIVLPVKYQVMDSFIVFLSTVMDSKFTKQQRILEQEFAKRDLYRSHLPMMVNLFCKIIDDATFTESGKMFRRMVKIWGYIVRIMLNACQDDTAKAYEACQAVFTTLNQFFLATPSPQTLASQTIAIQHLDALFAELHPFSEEQRFEFMATTLNSIDFEASGLRTHFLKMLNRLICNNGFEKVSVLGRVYESVLNWTFEAVQKESFAPKSSSPGVVTELAVEVLNSSLGCLKEMPREIQEKVMLSIPKEMWLEVLTFSLKTQLHSRSSSLESQIEVRIGNHQSLAFHSNQALNIALLFISFGDLFEPDFLIDIFKSIRNVKVFRQVVSTIRHFIFRNPFNQSWVLLNAIAGSTMEKILCAMYTTITDYENPIIPVKNILSLYAEIIDVGAMLLFSDFVGMSSISFQKSRILQMNQPHLRLSLANMLRDAVIGVNKLREYLETPLDYPIDIVHRLFAACIGPESNVRFFALELLLEITMVEYSAMGNFRFIEHLCFSQLHDLVASKQLQFKPVDFMNGFFIMSLHATFDHKNDEFGNLGRQFIKSLRRFVNNLASECSPEQNDEYVNALMRMLRFLKQIRHKGLFVTYVHQLYQHHLNRKNYVEAAMALMQESELLHWRTNVYIENASVYSLPDNCTEFELNEQIHLTCIKLLDMAQYWERALELTRVLEQQYGLKVHDYQKLSEVLKIRVALYEKIFQEHRPFPAYFRAAFFGTGFGEIAGKQYIYRGDNWEQLGSFCERLKVMYEPVQFVHSKASFDPSTLKEGDRVIQINAVDAVADIRSWNRDSLETTEFHPLSWSIEKKSVGDFEDIPLYLFTPELYWEDLQFQELLAVKERIPQYIKTYYESNEISMFSLSRPIKKEYVYDYVFDQNAKEFANLWIEKTILFTEFSLPCLARKSKVVQSMTFEVSPIENAIITMRTKTRELLAFEAKYKQYSQRNSIDTMGFAAPADSKWSIDTITSSPSSQSEGNQTTPDINVNPFSMALQGAIDAPVNGGVSMYKSAFLRNPSYYQHLDNQKLCRTLESSIMEQVEVISRCLPLHGELVPTSMRPFHKEMINAFQKNFADEVSKLRTDCNNTQTPSIALSSSNSSFNSTKLHARLSFVSKNSRSLSLIRNNSLGDLIDGYKSNASPEPTASKRSSTPLNAFSRMTLTK